jgi:hypothetical protein
MATQDVTLVKKAVATGMKCAVPLDRYDVYTSEADATYPFNTGARQPQTIVVVYELKGSANTWAKVTCNTVA